MRAGMEQPDGRWMHWIAHVPEEHRRAALMALQEAGLWDPANGFWAGSLVRGLELVLLEAN